MISVLCTGATGFLGKHVQDTFEPYIVNNDYFVAFLGSNGGRGDLASPALAYDVFSRYEPDVVVHMAAVCGGILANKNAPAKFLSTNLQMGLNIFELAVQFKVKYVYTLGSVCSYPKYCPVPFKEDDIWNGYPEETNAPYGFAKKGLLMLGNTYREQYGVRGAHLIPVNLYGPYDHFDLVNSHVIPALINKFTDAIQNNKDTVYCWGTGAASREFLYAGDAAKAIVQAVTTGLDTELPINIGTGDEITIKDLAYLIAKLTGFEGNIEFTGEVSDGQPKRRLDVSRAKEIMGFEAKTKLLEGLVRTISWYQDNLEKTK